MVIKDAKSSGFFLIADLSGYTAMTEVHGAYSTAQAVAKFKKIVKKSLEANSELIENVGDEVVILSDQAESIIKTAILLLEESERETYFPRIHIGIDYGSYLKDNGHYLDWLSMLLRA